MDTPKISDICRLPEQSRSVPCEIGSYEPVILNLAFSGQRQFFVSITIAGWLKPSPLVLTWPFSRSRVGVTTFRMMMRNSKRESDTGIPAPLAGWNEEDNEPSVKVPNAWLVATTRERETMDAFQSKHINCTQSHTHSTQRNVSQRERKGGNEKLGSHTYWPNQFPWVLDSVFH